MSSLTPRSLVVALPLATVFAASLAMLGCDDDVKHGTPALKKLLVLPGGETVPDLLAPPDGGVGAVSPMSQFQAVFNDLLDGSKIEPLVDGGRECRPDIATITWLNATGGAPAIGTLTCYNPAGSLGVNVPGPSILVQPQPGLPSGAMLRLTLARDKIVGKNGKPYTGEEMFTVQTEPFSASANIPMGGFVAPAFELQVIFNNVPAATAKNAITMTQGNGMRMVALVVTEDSMNPLALNVKPMGATSWTMGETYELMVGAAASDQFNVKLPAATMFSFTVGMAPADGGAPPGPDGGVLADALGGVDASVGDLLSGNPDAGVALDGASSQD
jgi:hypothetical protein